MDPTIRYELRPGEWRPVPPHVSYDCDRTGLAALLGAEQRSAPTALGSSTTGPALEVRGRKLACPVSEADLEWLASIAAPAPYGRGADTLVDPAVRDALQVGAEDVRLGTPAWSALQSTILSTVATDMGLEDATLRLEPLKLLIYRPGGHFTEHADTEKTPGMLASLSLIVPGEYEGGAFVVEHDGKRVRAGDDGAPHWRWVAWYADCRHWLEPVRSGVRVAMTFGVVVDPRRALPRAEPSDRRLGWSLWERSYAESHTAWAARGGRRRSGAEQYGRKLVWVLSHRYTERGLRGALLKGRDRELARVLVDEPHGEACYLAWLQIRETGSAYTASDTLWGVDEYGLEDREGEPDYEPPLGVTGGLGEMLSWAEADPAPLRLKHQDTPELHLHSVARHNAWVEGLRSLDGEPVDHGVIEVLDGELAPPGALADATPTGGRVYEATGNEGASLELQYRHAVLVLWRRNAATLRMLARCGGRMALAVELAQRDAADTRRRYGHEGGLLDALRVWREALANDGGGAAPEAHRLLLGLLPQSASSREGGWLRDLYVVQVAAVDLEVVAVPTLVAWFEARIAAGESVGGWLGALRKACDAPFLSRDSYGGGAPALLRALAAKRGTRAFAFELLSDRREPPNTRAAVLREAQRLEEAHLREEWRRGREAKVTADD